MNDQRHPRPAGPSEIGPDRESARAAYWEICERALHRDDGERKKPASTSEKRRQRVLRALMREAFGAGYRPPNRRTGGRRRADSS